MTNKIIQRKLKRKSRSRAKTYGKQGRPRLTVYKSNMHIYAQIIDDTKAETLVSFSDKNLKGKKDKSKTDIAYQVGESLAKKANSKKIKKVSFDRSGYKYHGRVKALAEGARKGGLSF